MNGLRKKRWLKRLRSTSFRVASSHLNNLVKRSGTHAICGLELPQTFRCTFEDERIEEEALAEEVALDLV